jgi:methyl-accepting chemotaxis protein
MQQRTWRRRNYFIRKDFQGRFILRFFLAILIGAAVFASILSVFSAHTMTVTYEDFRLTVDRTPKALFLHIIRAYGVYIVLLGIVASVISLFLSHRIAGPIFRFERSVEEITRGNLSFRIALRSKDEGKELAELMNTMLDTLSGRLREISRHADAARSGIAGLSQGTEEGAMSPEELKGHISETAKSIESLRECLSFFTLDKG